MRTTVELRDDLRARLVALAARRGMRGFSRLVEEALERFLDAESDAERARRVVDALAALGSLPARSAAAMRGRVRDARRRWRA
jgi:predicted transcriptional regulator